MLPSVSVETRNDFVERMVECLVTVGGADMAVEEFKTFKDKLINLVKRATPRQAPPQDGKVNPPAKKG